VKRYVHVSCVISKVTIYRLYGIDYFDSVMSYRAEMLILGFCAIIYDCSIIFNKLVIFSNADFDDFVYNCHWLKEDPCGIATFPKISKK
jgi:hypothetical protein